MLDACPMARHVMPTIRALMSATSRAEPSSRRIRRSPSFRSSGRAHDTTARSPPTTAGIASLAAIQSLAGFAHAISGKLDESAGALPTVISRGDAGESPGTLFSAETLVGAAH